MKIDLRDIFPNETTYFTPWLAKNNLIPDIAKTLNIFDNPISLFKTEATIGEYRIDMIYKEKEGEGGLIVENQYENSDSKHLGQVLIYSQLTNISNILWICESVKIEHRRVSDMLKTTSIIPIAIEFHQIDEGYIMNVHAYKKDTPSIISYKLDKDLKVEYRKI